MPPISATWPTVPRKPRRSPSKKNGVTSRCSGMCEPPRYGSLWTITSPGSNASAPTSSITQRPEKSACPSIAGFMFAIAIRSPFSSRIRNEKSSPSLKIGEYAVRIIATAISSQMLTNCECRIFRNTGSATRRLQPRRELALPEDVRLDEQQAPMRVRTDDLPVEDERRRVHFLDDQRPAELHAEPELLAPVDRRLDPAELLEVDRARRHRARLAERRERQWRGRVAVLACDGGQVDELDDAFGDAVAVRPLVGVVEAIDGQAHEVVGLERHADLLLVVLAEVAAAHGQGEQRVVNVAFPCELLERAQRHRLEPAPEVRVDRLVRAEDAGRAAVDAQVGRERAERRRQTGARRHEDAGEPDAPREQRRVRWPGAAERHQLEPSIVEAAVRRQETDRVRHVLGRELDDRLGAVFDRHSQPVGDRSDRLVGTACVERDLPAEEVVGIEAAEDEVRVGHGRLRSAASVGRRARLGAGALGPDLEQPALVERDDRAPTGADRRQVDDGHPDRQAPFELVLRRRADLPLHDDADVAARPAHVERDDVGPAELGREMPAGDQPPREPGEDQVDRVRLGRTGRDLTAVRLDEEARHAHALALELVVEVAGKPSDQTAEVAVDDHRVRPFVLAPDRSDLIRDRHRDVRQPLAQRRGESLLVVGPHVREEKADRDRGTVRSLCAPRDLRNDPLDLLVLERHPYRPVECDALTDADAVRPRDVRARLHPLHVEQRLAVDALDEGDVLEARRRQEDHALTLALEQAVRRHRRAEDEQLDLVRGNARATERVEDRRRRLRGGGRNLDRTPLPRCVVDDDEVGERAARVDSDPDAHVARAFPLWLGTKRTVDHKGGSRQVRRRVQGEIAYEACDLAGRAVTTRRDRVDERGLRPGDRLEPAFDPLHHRRVDAAGTDGVRADAVAGDLARERPRQANQSVLRRAVRRRVLRPREACAGRDVDDPPSAPSLELRQDGLQQPERAEQVDVVELNELVRGDVLEWRQPAFGSGGVDDGVDRAERVDGAGDERLDLLAVAEVGRDREAPVAHTLQRSRVGICEHELRIPRPERRDDRRAEPASRPCDQHDRHTCIASRPNCAVRPPSTRSTAPVTNDARSEQRNATAEATSSASPTRPSACSFAIHSCRAGGWLVSNMSLRMKPGATQLTLMSRSARSSAICRVRWCRPPFDAQYAESRFIATSPLIEPTFTTAPRPERVSGSTRWSVRRYGAVRFVSMTSRQPAGVPSAAPSRIATPALLTRMSTRPKRLTTAPASASRLSSLRTSTSKASAFPPASAISRTASAVRSRSRLAHATVAPRPARSSAIARPIPRLAPVTTATRPERSSDRVALTTVAAGLRAVRPSPRGRARSATAGRPVG